MYIIFASAGGYDGNSAYNHVLEWDIDLRNWNEIGQMAAARYAHAVSLVELTCLPLNSKFEAYRSTVWYSIVAL